MAVPWSRYASIGAPSLICCTGTRTGFLVHPKLAIFSSHNSRLDTTPDLQLQRSQLGRARLITLWDSAIACPIRIPGHHKASLIHGGVQRKQVHHIHHCPPTTSHRIATSTRAWNFPESWAFFPEPDKSLVNFLARVESSSTEYAANVIVTVKRIGGPTHQPIPPPRAQTAQTTSQPAKRIRHRETGRALI